MVAGPEDADILADFNCRMALETEGKTLDFDTVSKAGFTVTSLWKTDIHNSFGFYLIAVGFNLHANVLLAKLI